MRSVHCTTALVVCVYSADEVVKSASPHFESDFSLLYVLKQSLFTKIKKGLQNRPENMHQKFLKFSQSTI